MTLIFWLVVAVYLWYAWHHYYGEYKFWRDKRRMYERLEKIK